MEEMQISICRLPICASCDKIRAAESVWLGGEVFIEECIEIEFTPTVCPECAKRFFPHLCEKAAV